jgi:hypothetical protein
MHFRLVCCLFLGVAILASATSSVGGQVPSRASQKSFTDSNDNVGGIQDGFHRLVCSSYDFERFGSGLIDNKFYFLAVANISIKTSCPSFSKCPNSFIVSFSYSLYKEIHLLARLQKLHCAASHQHFTISVAKI